jgi:hypothetical protein
MYNIKIEIYPAVSNQLVVGYVWPGTNPDSELPDLEKWKGQSIKVYVSWCMFGKKRTKQTDEIFAIQIDDIMEHFKKNGFQFPVY